jgi:hypothetical protein
VPTPPLAEDVLMLTLHPEEERRPHDHDGVGDTVRAATLVDEMLAGAPIPTQGSMIRTLRFGNRRNMDGRLDLLIAAGRVERIGSRSRFASRPHRLLDAAARERAQQRLYAGLAPEPDARSAALAMLIGIGGLLPWAARPGDSPEALAAIAGRVASGIVVPAGLHPTTLRHYAVALRDSIFMHTPD